LLLAPIRFVEACKCCLLGPAGIHDSAVRKMPTKKDQVLNRVKEILADKLDLEEGPLNRLATQLRNDPSIASLLSENNRSA
jgi:hypothetical protein